MKEALGFATVLIGIAQTVPYVWDIFRGKTKPHLFTYLIWSIVTVIIFFGQFAAGAGPGSWSTAIMSIGTFVVFTVCFKYGTEDITWLDGVFLVGAIAAIIPWWLTKDPMISVLCATLIDVCAFIPTIRKTYKDPESEALVGWAPNLVRHPIAILALTTYNVTTVVYPLALFLMNFIVVYVIVSRRQRK